MRLVLDTNVVISALFWSGPPHRLLELATENVVEIFCSEELLAELQEVLGRPKFFRKLAEQGASAAELAQRFRDMTELVAAPAVPKTSLRDPDDALLLACAAAAHVDAIVSGDFDLLSLGQYEGIHIFSPAECVTRLAGATDAGETRLS